MNIQQPTTRPHAEREYLHTFTAGALLPMAQATLMGVVVFLVAWMIARIVFDAVDPHKWAIIPGAGVWVWNLFRLFHHWLNLTTIETVLQKDINGDGVIGPMSQPSAANVAKPRKVVIQMDQVKENGHYQAGDRTDVITFPCDDEQLYTLASGLMNGMSFAEKQWTPLESGKPFSIKTFRDVKDVMRDNNLIEYVSAADPRQGMKLTDTGKALMKEIAASPTPL